MENSLNTSPNKQPPELELISIRQNASPDRTPAEPPQSICLQDKIDEYIEKIGADSPHLFGIIIQLLSHGKVRVDFRYYSERLELKNIEDRLPRAQAIEWMDSYLYRQSREECNFNRTHRIVIPRLKNEG